MAGVGGGCVCVCAWTGKIFFRPLWSKVFSFTRQSRGESFVVPVRGFECSIFVFTVTELENLGVKR